MGEDDANGKMSACFYYDDMLTNIYRSCDIRLYLDNRMDDQLLSSLVGRITPVDRRLWNFSIWIVAIVLFQRDVVDFGPKRHTKMYM